jgi:pimeloyl-ACP methyl ester carboxylesterase
MASPSPSKGSVVLLHGLGRTGLSMTLPALALRRAGYQTLMPYYGLRRSMPEIIDHLAPRLTRFAAGHDGPLHLVTHSLGGLVARALITARRPEKLGRVVMLAPPNGGSELADLVTALGLEGAILGKVGPQLRTRRSAEAERLLGTVDFDLGIIAGDRPFEKIIAPRVMPGPHDGKVAVEATRVEGMRDHIVLPVQHTTMINDPRVIAQVLSYLETGAFKRS